MDAVREFFNGGIALDPCSNEHSAVSARAEYRLPVKDGLLEPWDADTIYVNPPYGRDRDRGTGIIDWLRRCSEANAGRGSEVLALVPVATNTRHWKLFVFGSAAAAAFPYDTRLRFLVDGREGGKGAPMSCAMVYWGARYADFERTFLRRGAVADIRPLRDKPAGPRGNGPTPDMWERRDASAADAS